MNRGWLWWAVLIIAGLGLTMMTVIQQREVQNSGVEPVRDEAIAQVEAETYASVDEASKAVKEILYKDMELNGNSYGGDGNHYIGTASYYKNKQLYLTLYYFVKEGSHFKLFIGRHDIKATHDIEKWQDHAGSYTFDCMLGPYDKVRKYEKKYNSLNRFEDNTTLLVKGDKSS
ncbi:hypothetical protein ERX27_05750 [Macrococcus brunensis]|uniref:Uncharacterized protein n=1 Tax=Macrococcus brunensis TaxID=198483 RepID=A0A4R6BDW2_9STAP|nr:hypothetical protein [Macrococcus brunensis]TDL97964.1 hypothetical protein ERX27_05750 [Macrococcus brunensis]ULG71777.1 hypothetical protein MGG12_10865 [Macrococcus brunensis]ULG74035.1 hypothetical protein MGG13_10365 [Macrococcus brunensis]